MTALQCSALIDEASKEDFVEEIKEEYEEVRDEHYDSLKVRNIYLCSIYCCFFFCRTKIYSTPQVDLSCVGKDFSRVMWANRWLANTSFPALGNTLRFDWLLHSYYVTLRGFLKTSTGFILWQPLWTFLTCLQDRKYLSLEKARLKKANLDWVDFTPGMNFLFVKFLYFCYNRLSQFDR